MSGRNKPPDRPSTPRSETPGGNPSRRADQVIQFEQHAGPIPSPDTLDAYERSHPGLAREIVRWTSEEQHNRITQSGHDRQMQRDQFEAGVEDQRTGRDETRRAQWMLFAILGGCFLTAVAMAFRGKDAMAALFMSPVIFQVLRLFFPQRPGGPPQA